MLATFMKTLIFTVFVPGTVTVAIPYLLIRSNLPLARTEIGIIRYAGLALIIPGALIYLWCAYDFWRARGTPAPIDPPKELVVRGLYRYVRNPMYVGVLSIVFGVSISFGSGLTAVYGAGLWLMFHVFVMFYEEPTLRRLFGESYEKYCREVGRWWPSIR